MNLRDARELKQRIRFAASTLPLAVGISRGYRVAVLLTHEDDRRYLECPRLKDALSASAEDIDVEVIGEVVVEATPPVDAPRDPILKIGASVGHEDGGVGSLGFFAARRSDGARGLVSCNHVIALVDEARDGDRIVSPSMLDGNGTPIGFLDGRYPRLGGGGKIIGDCAFAALGEGIRYDAASLDEGSLVTEPAAIDTALTVTKTGRVTNARAGVIEKIEIDDLFVRYGTIRAAFRDVIQIGSASPARFCDPGDSGALVYTMHTFQPVGLLFATSYIGGPHDAGWTWASPIRHVTAALNVDLVNA